MGLSRLDNFLKSVRGTILYVNPNDLDATDSIENQGNSLTRPFKTIQRALIESSRFSYQKGLDNDRFGKTTILLYPGEHVVDNRPGYIPDGANNYKLRNGSVTNDLPPYDLNSNFDLDSPNNELYKLNSVHGGVIVPRGTSIVGLDLRKTKVRPKYVPNPENVEIERTSLFRITGDCYFWQFSMFDADPNGKCYIDYTANEFVPNFSHHKLTCFEYADGVNNVDINDDFLIYSTDSTDLQMYYEKVSIVYGQSSGRAIEPDYPSTSLDIQPKIDEYRIVGSTGLSVGITSIKSGDGITPTSSITVTTSDAVPGLDVDTPFRVSGIVATGYNGQFVVSERPTTTTVVYQVQNPPTVALPSPAGSTLALSSDTVTSSSPYIFNCSLRSVYGMCGMLADGSKATGFKSMVVAQFTGIGLQKDDNAFVIYNKTTGVYDDNSAASKPLSTNSNATYKPSYRNYHLKVNNDAVVQAVSVFAIGYAEHFVTETGGDISLTNSNSNFGAKALSSKGFKKDAFKQDDKGYITHIIPPKEVPLTETSIEFELVDVAKTGPVAGIGSTANLYLYGQTNQDTPPENVLEGYRFGTRTNDSLKVLVAKDGSATEYSSRIVMPGSQSSSEKNFTVKQGPTGINSIGARSDGGNPDVITLTAAHDFLEGESVRIISDNGRLPDGLVSNEVYYAITSGLTTNTNIKVAETLDGALKGNALSINDKGGLLKVVSRVSDKNSGDIGHPIQWDITNSQWYVKAAADLADNEIYSTIVSLGTTDLGAATPRTYFKRKSDNRNSIDTLYRARYVVPKDGGVSRPPNDGYIVQESNTSIGSTDGEIQTYFGTGSITNESEQRNFRFIADATWDGSNVNVSTELPHNLSVGSRVQLVNIKSSTNTTATLNSGYNKEFAVTGITGTKNFTVGLTTNPGTFTNDTSLRTTALPYFKRKTFKDTYYVYSAEEAKKYVSGEQDGIYYLTLLNASNSTPVTPFTDENFSQPVSDLYPQTNRDNPNSDPDPTVSFATADLIGDVVVDNTQNSVTRETLNKFNADNDIGVNISNIASQSGTAHTIYSDNDHGLNRITKVSVTAGGAGYGSGSAGDIYNASLVAIGASVTGKSASAKITVNGSGAITAVKIMDGGSAYGIGNTLAVTGVTTFAPYTQAVVTVDDIYDNVGDTVRVIGVSSASYAGYNDLYRITGVDVGAAKTVTLESASTVSGFSGDVGTTLCDGSYFYSTGEAVRINTLVYNKDVGIATVTTTNRHGLRVDNKVRFTGANEALYNGSFVVNENINLNSFSVKVGVGTIAPTATGTLFAYREGYASNDGVITVDNENLNGRMVPTYAGITTTLSGDMATPNIEEVNLTNLSKLDVNIGDYLMVDDELIRVKTTTTGSNPLYVFRGVLGTKRTTHTVNSVVRKVSANPIELRRHSIIRASGHTFEYVGFGPGNYSTAFPDKQDRQVTFTEELLAQSTKKDAGAVFYTGMNDKGVSYNGNKRLSSATGKEEIFNTPVATVTGEDISDISGLNVSDATEINVHRSIKVEGGTDNKVASEFNGPIIVNNKLTSNSSRGIEAQSYYIQGNQTVSRKYTLSGSAPSLSGAPGDVTYYSDPSDGGYVGWVYTVDNDWRRFGSVSLSKDENIVLFDQVGIGTTTPGVNKLQVGSGTSLIALDSEGVGIGTTANGYALHVIGGTNIVGTLTATSFSGDGSNLTSLSIPATGWTQVTGGLYNTNLNNVGVGTTASRYNLELGAVGSSTTSLYANGEVKLVGILTANDVFVSGVTTAVNVDVLGGNATVGVVTTTNLHVGTGGTVIATSGIGSVGINSTQPTSTLDVQGHTKLKTYSENVGILTYIGSVVTVDLSEAQTFICTATDGNITQFNITNPPDGATSFTIRISQDANGGDSVAIDTFKFNGNTIPVYWPGGVVPTVTTDANKTDIYSFKIFDGSNPVGSGLYGVIGGQNFS